MPWQPRLFGASSQYWSSVTAKACSADGSVVVGDDGVGAFRWTDVGGLAYLDASSSGFLESAGDCSADGSVVVGRDGASGQAYRWTAAGEAVLLGQLDVHGSSAYGCSADGSVVVGLSPVTGGDGYPQNQAFRWTEAGGMVNIGSPVGAVQIWVEGCSGDGSTIVGYWTTTSNQWRAFRWSESGGMLDLGALFPEDSRAYVCSTDGSVVFVNMWDEEGYLHVYRWVEGVGAAEIPAAYPSASADYFCTACSPDGATIYGDFWDYESSGVQKVFRWSSERGTEVLVADPAVASWNITGCADDGSVVVGSAKVDGLYRSAHMTFVPDPFWTGFINCEELIA